MAIVEVHVDLSFCVQASPFTVFQYLGYAEIFKIAGLFLTIAAIDSTLN